MNIVLSPPSGHADSYLDITFRIRFDEKVDQAKITVFNDTVNEPLDILGVIGGFISLETTAIFKDSLMAEGFINIFNQDKMNKKLGAYQSVDIRFVAEVTINGEQSTIENVVVFYNESQSLDADIIPFDVSIDNPDLDIASGEPLRINVTSDVDKSYEIAIKSEFSEAVCNFMVAARKGRTSISIPSEVIYSDLELDRKRSTKCGLYYVKRKGVTYARLMNHVYIAISNSALTFRAPKTLMPKAQTRLSPIGTELGDDFVLSDRYLVHTHKDFSSFGKKTDFHPRRLSYLTRFFHESQDMIQPKSIKSLGVSEEENMTDRIKESIRTEELKKHDDIKNAHQYSEDRGKLMKAFSYTYEQQYGANVKTDLFYLLVSAPPEKETSRPIEAFQAPLMTKGKGCLSCARRRKNNA